MTLRSAPSGGRCSPSQAWVTVRRPTGSRSRAGARPPPREGRPCRSPPRTAARRRRTAVALGLTLARRPAVPPDPPPPRQAPVELQILGINDFHGHLDPRTGAAPSVAGVLGGAVAAAARGQNPNTVFVSAGDNIGASPFISVLAAATTPTIDVLNAMGLAVSAVGNHEFDRGYADLAGRVSDRGRLPATSAPTSSGESPALPAYAVVETRRRPRRLHRRRHRSRPRAWSRRPASAGITFERPGRRRRTASPPRSRTATRPTARPTSLVLLAHEGAATAAATPRAAAALQRDRRRATTPSARSSAASSADVDAILGGHTHLRVDCDLPGPGAAAASGPRGRASTAGRSTGCQLTCDPAHATRSPPRPAT